MRRRKSNSKLLVFLIFLMIFVYLFPTSQSIVRGANDGSLSVAIIRDGEILLDVVYTAEQLQALPQTKQCYTSWTDDSSAEIILAEGILVTDLLADLELTSDDVASYRLYSTEGRNSGFTKNFLFGPARYYYPSLLEGSQIDDPEPGEDNRGEDNGGEDNGGGAENTDEDTQLTTQSLQILAADPEIVSPMLALRSYQSDAYSGIDWSRINSDSGIRLCYGQIDSQEVCSTMYGTNFYRLELTLSSDSSYGREDDYVKPEDGVVYSKDTYDDNAVSGSDKIPSELKIEVGYYGYEFVEIKTFNIDELKSLPIIKQAYTLGSGTEIVVAAAYGVRLSDILAASGIKSADVKYFYFYTEDAGDQPKLTMSKSELLDTTRYYYPYLAMRWNSSIGKPTSGAAAGSQKVDTIIAFRDNWGQSSSVPDFYKLTGANRFRLFLGQTTTTSQTAEKSVKWITRIGVMLDGKPPDDPVEDTGDDDGDGTGTGTGSGTGTGIGSGTGTGTGTGSGIGSGAGADGSGGTASSSGFSAGLQDSSDTTPQIPGVSTMQVHIGDINEVPGAGGSSDSLSESGGSGWKIYEVNDPETFRSTRESTDKSDYIALIIAVTLSVFGGASLKTIFYKKELKTI